MPSAITAVSSARSVECRAGSVSTGATTTTWRGLGEMQPRPTVRDAAIESHVRHRDRKIEHALLREELQRRCPRPRPPRCDRRRRRPRAVQRDRSPPGERVIASKGTVLGISESRLAVYDLRANDCSGALQVVRCVSHALDLGRPRVPSHKSDARRGEGPGCCGGAGQSELTGSSLNRTVRAPAAAREPRRPRRLRTLAPPRDAPRLHRRGR